MWVAEDLFTEVGVAPAGTPGAVAGAPMHYRLVVPVSRAEAMALCGAATKIREQVLHDRIECLEQHVEHIRRELAVELERAPVGTNQWRQIRLAQEFVPVLADFIHSGHLPVWFAERMSEVAQHGLRAVAAA